MRQPDDPGPPEDYSEEANRTFHGKHDRDRWNFWSLVLAVALVAVMGLLAFSYAFGQDPPVPLEEPCPSGDCTIYNQAFLFAFTNDERMIRWSLVQSDVDTMDLFTEIAVFEFPPKGTAFPVMKAELPEIERAIGWTPTRAGTYFVKARACRTDVADPNDPDAEPHPSHGVIICSIMIESLDPAHTDPNVYPRGFVMLIKLAPATGGGIE